MSYDLYVVRRDIPEDCWYYVCDRDYDERTYDQFGRHFNYTYNLGPFFAAYHVRPSTDLDGKTGGECAELIRQALMSIYQQTLHELRSEYNPRDSDGQLVDWGSVDGAIKWLERVHDYCREHPDYVVKEYS